MRRDLTKAAKSDNVLKGIVFTFFTENLYYLAHLCVDMIWCYTILNIERRLIMENDGVLDPVPDSVQEQEQETSADDLRIQTSENEDRPDNRSKKKKKRTAKSYALSFFIKLGIAFVVLFIIFKFFVAVHICHTNSAYPSVRDGDLCLVNRLAELKQEQLIVYKQEGEVRFGRIVAMGGDKVEIKQDSVYVNDYVLSEKVVYPTSPEGSAISYPYEVPKDSVFVLNDYRSDISDSRTYGAVAIDDVEGVVVFTMRMRGI